MTHRAPEMLQNLHPPSASSPKDLRQHTNSISWSLRCPKHKVLHWSYSSFSGNLQRQILLLLFSRCVQLLATPWTEAPQAPLSSNISWSLLIFMCIESAMLSNQLIPCCPLLLPSIFLSIRVFSNLNTKHDARFVKNKNKKQNSLTSAYPTHTILSQFLKFSLLTTIKIGV